MMWKYVRKYIPLGVLGALFMVGEVCMDLLQPSLMSEIVDEACWAFPTAARATWA